MSSYTSAARTCNEFKYGPQKQTLLTNDCSGQISGWDVPHAFYWYQICHFEKWNWVPVIFGFPPIPEFESDEVVHGHVNWQPVTYTGSLQFQDISNGFGEDEDTNIRLFPDRTTAPQLYETTIPGLTPNNIEDGQAFINTEYFTPDVLAAFGGFRWPFLGFFKFLAWQHRLQSLSYPRGVAVGLMGLDARHDAKTELHPLYAFAAQEPTNSRGEERWLVMFRNNGEEGGCSTHNPGQHPLNTPGNRITLPLPLPAGSAGFALSSRDQLYGIHVAGGNQAPLSTAVSPDGHSALITVTLPAPDTYPVLVGEIGILPITGVPRPNSAQALVHPKEPPYKVPLGHVNPENRNAEPETLLPTLTKVLTPAERRKYLATSGPRAYRRLHARGVKPSVSVCQVLGPAARRARRHHLDRRQTSLIKALFKC